MLVSNVTINTYSKIGYLWNAFKNQILQPKADQWNWSATLHTSSYYNTLTYNKSYKTLNIDKNGFVNDIEYEIINWGTTKSTVHR